MNYNKGSTIYHKNLAMQNVMIKCSKRKGHAKIGTPTHMKNSSTTSMNQVTICTNYSSEFVCAAY